LRHRNESLKNDNERLLAANKALTLLAEELATLKPKHAELEATAEQLDKDLKREKSFTEILHRRLTATQADLDTARAQNTQLRAENAELALLADELADLKPKHATLAEQHDALQREFAALSREHEALVLRSQEMEARIAALESDLAEERRQHDALRKDHAEKTATLQRVNELYQNYTEQWRQELEILRREGSTYARFPHRPGPTRLPTKGLTSRAATPR
jgi:chromosome segregation ATPase